MHKFLGTFSISGKMIVKYLICLEVVPRTIIMGLFIWYYKFFYILRCV